MNTFKTNKRINVKKLTNQPPYGRWYSYENPCGILLRDPVVMGVGVTEV